MSPHESQILATLLSQKFSGSEELSKQAELCQVDTLDENGSLKLFVPKSLIPAVVKYSIPVEADYSDCNSPDLFAARVHILLHVKDGYMHELEIYKDDGSPILKTATTEELNIFVPEQQ